MKLQVWESVCARLAQIGERLMLRCSLRVRAKEWIGIFYDHEDTIPCIILQGFSILTYILSNQSQEITLSAEAVCFHTSGHSGALLNGPDPRCRHR